MQDQVFKFSAKVWLYDGPAAWHFITLPHDISEQIDFYFKEQKRGWGSLPVMVTIGKTTWKTSIFPDKQLSSYLLPLKLEVRKEESLQAGDLTEVYLKIRA